MASFKNNIENKLDECEIDEDCVDSPQANTLKQTQTFWNILIFNKGSTSFEKWKSSLQNEEKNWKYDWEGSSEDEQDKKNGKIIINYKKTKAQSFNAADSKQTITTRNMRMKTWRELSLINTRQMSSSKILSQIRD